MLERCWVKQNAGGILRQVGFWGGGPGGVLGWMGCWGDGGVDGMLREVGCRQDSGGMLEGR